AEVLADALVAALELEAVLLLQRDAELERVDRVEAEAVVGEERRVVADVLGLDLLAVQHVDHEALQVAQQIGHVIANRSTKNRSSASVRLRAPARSFATSAAGVTQASTSTSMRTTRGGHAYHFAPLVSTRGSQRSTTGTMGTPVVSAICAAPRTKCSGSPGTVRVPSGKMMSGSPCASFAAQSRIRLSGSSLRMYPAARTTPPKNGLDQSLLFTMPTASGICAISTTMSR